MRFFRQKTKIFRQSGKELRSIKLTVYRRFRARNLELAPSHLDPKLEKIIAAWDHLPEKIRQAILIMVGA